MSMELQGPGSSMFCSSLPRQRKISRRELIKRKGFILPKSWGEKDSHFFSVALLQSQKIQYQAGKCALGDSAERYSSSQGVGRGLGPGANASAVNCSTRALFQGQKELQTFLVGGRSWKRGPGGWNESASAHPPAGRRPFIEQLLKYF